MHKLRRTLGASSLIHDKVVNLAGQDIGRIEELMVDVVSGRVAYVVLSFGGFMGIGNKLFALPWSAITVDEVKQRFVVTTRAAYGERPSPARQDRTTITPSRRGNAAIRCAIGDLLDAHLAGTMRAAEILATRFHAVTDDRYLAVEAARREYVDRALKRIEEVRCSSDRELEGLVVSVAAGLAILGGHPNNAMQASHRRC